MQIDSSKLDGKFPQQRLSYKQKSKNWAAQCVNWGAMRNVMTSSPIRKSVRHKQINYDLLNGKLHMEDLKLIVNPELISASFIPERIQHYPIMNTKLQVLQGEEYKRVFDYRVIVTNPTAISEIEKNKSEELKRRLQSLIESSAATEEDAQAKLQELSDYINYEWQDIREIRANALIRHYSKEQNFPKIFNDGFKDAEAVGEELYQCAIEGGEPVLRKLNPRKVRVYQSGYSNKIEDADMIVIEDYWSPSRIIDTYGECLTEKDIDYIQNIRYHNLSGGTAENEDLTRGFIRVTDSEDVSPTELFPNIDEGLTLMPYDFEGNVRVCQVYWKSLRKIKKIKSYDPLTGEAIYNIYTEDVTSNPAKGEEETPLWINQAWEGVKIGEKVYVNMRPCPIQFNKLGNPSKCHFGIIGSIYNLNDDKPFSLVDIMKPYNYFYNVIYDRLNKLIARNHGKVIKLDFAKVPAKWDIDKWMSVLKTYGVAVEDSFKEGNKGMATGKLAGSLNNASSGVVDAELGQSIQQHISLLEYIKNEMSEVVGISKQREGQISNRETVGGVERATLQSSHITEWIFITHDDVKKRTIECFLEVAKIALRGRNPKFQYILSDMSQQVMNIEGDLFSECDYGLVVDNSYGTQELKNNLPSLIQAGLQNNKISFGTAIKIWGSQSIAEQSRMIERDEQRLNEQAQQAQQQQLQSNQEIARQQEETKRIQLEQQDKLNERDNDTKVLIATMQLNAKQEEKTGELSEAENAKLKEEVRQFNEKMKLEREKLQKSKTNK